MWEDDFIKALCVGRTDEIVEGLIQLGNAQDEHRQHGRGGEQEQQWRQQQQGGGGGLLTLPVFRRGVRRLAISSAWNASQHTSSQHASSQHAPSQYAHEGQREGQREETTVGRHAAAEGAWKGWARAAQVRHVCCVWIDDTTHVDVDV